MNVDSNKEKARLVDISVNAGYIDNVITATCVGHLFKVFSRFFVGRTILEIGPAEGNMTDLLVSLDMDISILDGAVKYCEGIEERHADVSVHHALIEEFVPGKKYDNIVLGHVLEHVVNPVEVLERIATWLEPGGQILAAVPNARSLHRQAAVGMGLLESETSLNETDIRIGHRRVYTPETFRNEFNKSGLYVDFFGGYWLKPLSNKQIEDSWNADMISAFLQLGELYPDIAAEIYVVEKRKV